MYLFVFSPLFFTARPLAAQSETSKAEAGAQFSVLKMNRFFESPAAPGIGGRFTWNLFPSLALETEFNFYPGDYTPVTVQDGGRTFSWFAGVKAAAIRRDKFAVFGKIRPGLVSFSNVFVQTSATSFETRRINHFATDLGGVFEYYPARRWIIRSDLGVTLIYIHAHTVPVGTSGSITSPGTLRPALQFSTGVSYRLGELQNRAEEGRSDAESKWEVAGQFVTQSRSRATFDTDVVTEPGIGGRATYDLLPHLSVEAALTLFVRSQSSTILDGGRSVQALFGVKSGVRREKFGYFLRVRPGFQSFTNTVTAISNTGSPIVSTGTKTYPALDLGGGVEVYTTKRTVLRFDAGDTLGFVGSRTAQILGSPVTVDGGTVNSFQFSTGFGWRF